MNETIDLPINFTSFAGSIQTLNQSSLKSYHINLKPRPIESQLIQKQSLMIHKLKNDNTQLRNYLSKAVSEISLLKLQLDKFTPLPKNVLELQEHIQNLDTQNSDLKKQLEQIQSQFAKYKDSFEKQSDTLMIEIAHLKRQIEESALIVETLNFENENKKKAIHEKEKQIWHLESSIAELTEQVYRKQSFIDKLKISQDQKATRDQFKYLESTIQNKRKQRQDILIEGQQYITTTDYQAAETIQCGVQTEIYEVFQFSSRCIERNSPSKRKNHHMSPETDKEERIHQYARQLTLKQNQCANYEKNIDLLKKQNKNMSDKILQKDQQLKKLLRKITKIHKKLQSTSKPNLSPQSSSDDANHSIIQKHSKAPILPDQVIKTSIAIQTDQQLSGNHRPIAEQQRPIQKGNHKQPNSETYFQQKSKKQKPRKNRTIEQDQQDGRQKLKFLIQDLQKKDSLLTKLELQATRNRQTLNQTRKKLRKKQNQCKKLAKDLREFKSDRSQNNPSHDAGESSVIVSDSAKADYCEVQIQTSLLNIESIMKTDSNEICGINSPKKTQNAVKQQIKNFKGKSDQMSDKPDANFSENINSEEKIKCSHEEQLKIILPNHISNMNMISHISPRSESYSHRQSGQKIINVQKIQRQNEYLRKQNSALKYQLEEIKRNWLQGLKNLQKEYCSQSGSDFHSERDIIGALSEREFIGAFSERELIPLKIRQKCELEIYNNLEAMIDKRLEKISFGIQTQEIQKYIHEELVYFENKKKSRMGEDKSQKSQSKSDQYHSHSKNQLQVSSETDEYYNLENTNQLQKPQQIHFPILNKNQYKLSNHSRQNDNVIKNRKRKNQLNVSQQKVTLINKQKNELKNQIQELKKALMQAKIKQQELLNRLKQQCQRKSLDELQEAQNKECGKQQIQCLIINHYKLTQKDQKKEQHTQYNKYSLQVEAEENNLKEAEVQTDDHEAIEISYIERTPDKNCDLSLRNDHLFDLEQPITSEQQVQTEDIQISFYRSFKLQPKEANNIFESSKIYSSQLAHKHQQYVQNPQIEPVDIKQAFIQSVRQYSQFEQIKNHPSELSQGLKIQNQSPQNFKSQNELNAEQTSNGGKNIDGSLKVQTEKLIQDNKELQVKVKDLQLRLIMLNQELAQQKALRAQVKVFKPNIKQLEEKVKYRYDSSYPSDMDNSHFSHYKSPVQFQNIQIQTEDIEHSLSQIKNKSYINFYDQGVQRQYKNLPKQIQSYQQNISGQIVDSSNYNLNILDIVNPHIKGFKDFEQSQIPSPQEFVQSKILQAEHQLKDTECNRQEFLGKYGSKQQKQQINLFKSEVGILKEQLILTQEQNFKLENQVHEFGIKVNYLKVQNLLLNEKISVQQSNILQHNKKFLSLQNENQNLKNQIQQLKDKVANKQYLIELKQQQLVKTNLILAKLKSEHSQIVASLNQYVDDSSDRSTPDKIKLLKDFQFTIPIHQNIQTTINAPQIHSIQSPILHNLNRLQVIHNLALNQQSQDQFISQNSLQKMSHQIISTKQQINPINQTKKEETSLKHNMSWKKKFLQNNQRQISQIEHEENQIEQSQTQNFEMHQKDQGQIEHEKNQIEQSQTQNFEMHQKDQGQIEHEKNQIEQSQTQNFETYHKEKQLSEMLIQQINESNSKCKFCCNYLFEIKKLQEQIRQLQKSIQKFSRKTVAFQSIKIFNYNNSNDLNNYEMNQQQQSKQIQKDPKLKAFQLKSKQIPFGQSIAINQDQFKSQIVRKKIIQMRGRQNQENKQLGGNKAQIFKMLQKVKISQKNVKDQSVKECGFDQIFSLENLNSLPFIYYDYNPNFIQSLLPLDIIESREISQIQDFQNPLNLNDSVVIGAQKQLEQMYQPALIQNLGEINIKLHHLKETQKKSQPVFSRQGFQTFNDTDPLEIDKILSLQEAQLIVQKQKQNEIERSNEPKIQKQQKIVQNVSQSQSLFSIVYLSAENSSLNNPTTQKLIQNPLSPIFLTSNQTNLSFTISKSFSTNQMTQMLFQNLLSDNQTQLKSSLIIVKNQMTILQLKLGQWICEIDKCIIKQPILNISSINQSIKQASLHGQQGQPKKDGEEIPLKNDFKNTAKDSKLLISQIIKTIGSNFLSLPEIKPIYLEAYLKPQI